MDSKREKDQDTDFTKITSVLLKSRTGEFDLESILFLKLRGLGICDLGCIGECTNLERLDLSGNNITKLVPLSSLRLLIVLNVSANRISNLVCKNTSYRSSLLEMFPNIKVLDGERVVGRGSDLYQLCKDIDDTIKAGLFKNGQLPELSEPWVEDGFWEIKRSNNAIIEEAYKQFNDVLHECRLLNNRAAHIISQTERSLSLKNQSKQYAV
ncbi:leucine-rich repeat-containing protein 61 isoform X4 [Hypomesus transpacificus]|uniref:leucine-rich repeat-containing protein 61 isoform X4 n=1 Tax=Hypomesus transpacificus TaxID=137520 RepID=UPI001F08078E|nr:leucine-rich repeat-containing protein 61 isoform X4 [Hypomesus transpacificus]